MEKQIQIQNTKPAKKQMNKSFVQGLPYFLAVGFSLKEVNWDLISSIIFYRSNIN